MRIGEAIGLGREDVDLEAGLITIRKAKLDRARLVPLHPTATSDGGDRSRRRRGHRGSRQAHGLSEGLRMVAPGGRYLIVGLWSASGLVSVEPRMLNNAHMRTIGSAVESPRHIYQAIEVATVRHQRFPLTDVVSYRFALEESQQALEAVGRLETVKAVIVPVGAVDHEQQSLLDVESAVDQVRQQR
jgi:hypothetical protein